VKPTRLGGAALTAGALLLSGAVAFTAGNAVQGSKIGETLISQSVNDIKPSQCSGITLTGLVTGTLIVNGTDANELILGSVAIDTINGGGGDDCIIGGALGDTLVGGLGNDVCIGGGGTDVLDVSCEVALQ
jgi:Ca2+-binding RTX toxin-like protein